MFISPENAVSINTRVPSPVSQLMLCGLLLRIVLSVFTVDSVISSPYFLDSFLVISVHARKYSCHSSLSNITPISLHVSSVVEHTFCAVALFFFLFFWQFGSLLYNVVCIIIIIIIVVVQYVCLLSQAFLPGTSLEPAVIPTAQAASFTLQYFPYYV